MKNRQTYRRLLRKMPCPYQNVHPKAFHALMLLASLGTSDRDFAREVACALPFAGLTVARYRRKHALFPPPGGAMNNIQDHWVLKQPCPRKPEAQWPTC